MIRRLLLSISLVSLCLLASPQLASAKDIIGVDCSKAGSSAACTSKTSTDPISGKNGLLLNIVDIVTYIAGAAAVIVILIAAIRFITSGSDTSVGSRVDEDVKNARNTIAGAIIGIVIIVMARTLIVYVVTKL